LTTSFAQKKLISETYFAKENYKGFVLIFNKNLTFNLKFYGHYFLDSADGTYQVLGDTVSLKYLTNNYELIIKSFKEQNKEIPLDIQLSASRAILRPTVLIKRRSKLYVVNQLSNGLRDKTFNENKEIILLKKRK
jgi:hypothetical protein